MKIEMRKTAEIIPYEKNPRLNDAAVDAVARSIKEFVFRQLPLLSLTLCKVVAKAFQHQQCS